MDDQLILFNDCSRYTILISSKRAEKGFKICSSCDQNYMMNFILVSKAFKIIEVMRLVGFTNSSFIVIQSYKSFFNYWEPNMVVLYIDNFFANVKLFQYLQKHEIGDDQINNDMSGSEAKILIFQYVLI